VAVAVAVYRSVMAEVEQAIRQVPLFSDLSKRDVKQLAAAMSERSFPAGAAITEKGKPGIGFFIIVNGTATVSDGGVAINTLKAGDHFGEIALIDEGPRMADVVAETDLDCYALAAWQFRPFVQAHPDVAWALLQSLVKRVVRGTGPPPGR
jgi:CRP/FNR family transcriptional regulator, cyclic AMP receptor protein